MATPSRKEIEDVGQMLFECLMNRIYNVSDFERLGDTTNKERAAIDSWLSRNEKVGYERDIF
jgi:hypothetical protein